MTNRFAILFIFLMVFSGCTSKTEATQGPAVEPINPSTIEEQPLSPSAEVPDFDNWRLFAREVSNNDILLLKDPAQNKSQPIHLPEEYLGPSLSPSGDRVAYWYDNSIEIFDINSGETIRLGIEKYGGFGIQTAWSPDETKVAVGCFPTETYPISEVCLFDLASGQMQPLTNLTNYTTDVYGGVDVGNWSTEANLLAFRLGIPPEQSGSTISLIFALDMDTLEPKLVFDERTQSTYSKIYLPLISPDGTKILFAAKVNGASDEILLLDVATGSIKQLTHSSNGGKTTLPAWLDNVTFTAATFMEAKKIVQGVYNISGQMIGEFDIPPTWWLLQAQPVE